MLAATMEKGQMENSKDSEKFNHKFLLRYKVTDMQQNRAVPTPIFNARKRPRQAVIAEPGAKMTVGDMGPSGAAMYQGLMPPGGYKSGAPYQANAMSARGDANQANARRNMYSNHQAQSNNGQRHQAQSNNGQRHQAQSNSGQRHQAQSNNGQRHQAQPNNGQRHQAQPNNGQRLNNNYSGGNNTLNAGQRMSFQGSMQQHQAPIPMKYQMNNSSYNQQYTDTGIAGNQYYDSPYDFNMQGQNQNYPCIGNSHGRDISQPGINRGTYGGQQGQIDRGSGVPQYNNSGRSYNFSKGSNKTNSHLSEQFPPSRGARYTSTHPNNTDTAFDDGLNDSFNFVPTQMLDNTANQQKKSTEKKVQDHDLTKTLHLLTVKAAGLRRWAKHRDTLQLMFEVYGYLDSAMGRSQTDCREFLLRDDAKDSINCVFYEIDRQVTKMTRGQWYKVVGTYDQKRDRLKCVSVRPMSEVERPLIQILVDKSSQELAKVTRKMREL